jgi:RNA polymerase sigma-70 factor (ECF subfamily)
MCQSDEECVRQCLAGRPGAFRRLVERHQQAVMRCFTVRFADREKAAEAAQETLVRAYFALPGLRKPESFLPWLMGIAARVAREMARDDKRRRGLPLDVEPAAELAAPGDGGVAGDTFGAGRVRQVVEALPELYREVIVLRFYGGLSCAQCGEHLGVPVTTVTKRLSRAYALLRESLRSEPLHPAEETP